MKAATIAVTLMVGQVGPWPSELEFPKELVHYKRAEHTQRIAITNGHDTITPVRRESLVDAWRSPGGLAGVKGWRSDLYKFIAPNSVRWVGDIAVWNGSNFQNNRGWKREYGDGTYFADVLSVDGYPFEVRFLEKVAGKWDASIAYRNPIHQPVGFIPFRPKHCALCHSQAGSGGYASGLVPGGDFILSDPFPALERN